MPGLAKTRLVETLGRVLGLRNSARPSAAAAARLCSHREALEIVGDATPEELDSLSAGWSTLYFAAPGVCLCVLCEGEALRMLLARDGFRERPRSTGLKDATRIVAR